LITAVSHRFKTEVLLQIKGQFLHDPVKLLDTDQLITPAVNKSPLIFSEKETQADILVNLNLFSNQINLHGALR